MTWEVCGNDVWGALAAGRGCPTIHNLRSAIPARVFVIPAKAGI